MLEKTARGTPQGLLIPAARIAGALWLVSILAGIYAEVFVRGALVVHGNAVATATRIMAAEPAFRLGFTADLVGDMAYTGVSILLYDLMRPVSRSISLIALAFGLTGCAIMAANLVNLFAPLVLLGNPGTPNNLAPEHATLALFFLRLHDQGYSLSIAFFSIQIGSLGFLILHSTLLPRFLGLLLVIEAVCNLVSSFGGFLALEWVGRLGTFILLPGLPAEAGMAFWLLVMGVSASGSAAIDQAGAHHGPEDQL